jgi:hypothetical protein
VSEDREKYGSGLTLDAGHVYRLDGVVLPSVTQILQSVLNIQYWGATEWHLERGHIVHQCAAMIARGEDFEHDPQIDGQVQACRAWFADRRPMVIGVERMVIGDGYAGTYDLLCSFGGKVWLLDWKATDAPQYRWQLGAYADADGMAGCNLQQGMTVELGENGKYKEGKKVDLRRARIEWRNILNVYKMKVREGLLK